MAKNIFYVAEHIKNGNNAFAMHLIKRCNTRDDAKEFCQKAVMGWIKKGFEAQLDFVEGVVVGAIAMTKEHKLENKYYIFETPLSMYGGYEGL